MRNQGLVDDPSRTFEVIQCAAFPAMIGSNADACAGPSHEVTVVALPVGEAVCSHVRRSRLRQVPLPYVRGPVTGSTENRPDCRDLLVELGVLRLDHVVDHAMTRQVTAGEEARPARGARRRVRVIAAELETL